MAFQTNRRSFLEAIALSGAEFAVPAKAHQKAKLQSSDRPSLSSAGETSDNRVSSRSVRSGDAYAQFDPDTATWTCGSSLIDLASTGAPAGLSGAVSYTQYPYRKGIAADVTGTGTVALRLAPWEQVFLEIQPRSDLKESVAFGARWFHDVRAGTSIVPDAKADKVRILLPGGDEQVVAVEPRHGGFRGELIAHSMRKLSMQTLTEHALNRRGRASAGL